MRIQSAKIGINVPRTITDKLLRLFSIKMHVSLGNVDLQILCGIGIMHLMGTFQINAANAIDQTVKSVKIQNDEIVDLDLHCTGEEV